MGSTLFVTGATGFIGAALVERAVAEGSHVRALTRSAAAAAQLRAGGAEPVLGDLAAPGAWTRAAASAGAVIHLAQPETFGARISQARAERYAALRLRMDRNLLEALGPDGVGRLVYVAGTSYYGPQGPPARDEDATPEPRGWGRHLAAAVDLLPAHAARGLPIVEAYPGWVYGPGSWFAEYFLRPLARGWRILAPRAPVRTVVPVHVEDAAAAVLHLATHGTPGRRYFVVDDRPSPWNELLALAAHALGRPLKLLPLPPFLYGLLVGPIIHESQGYDTVLTNARLRATGFTPRFPTIDQGVPDVVARWQSARRAAEGPAR